MNPFRAVAGPSRYPAMGSQWTPLQDFSNASDDSMEIDQIAPTPPPRARNKRKRTRSPRTSRPPLSGSTAQGEPLEDFAVNERFRVNQDPSLRASPKRRFVPDDSDELPDVDAVITTLKKKKKPSISKSNMSKDTGTRDEHAGRSRPSLPMQAQTLDTYITITSRSRRTTYSGPLPNPSDLIDLTNETSEEEDIPPESSKQAPATQPSKKIDVINLLDNDEEEEEDRRRLAQRLEKAAGKSRLRIPGSEEARPPSSLDATPPITIAASASLRRSAVLTAQSPSVRRAVNLPLIQPNIPSRIRRLSKDRPALPSPEPSTSSSSRPSMLPREAADSAVVAPSSSSVVRTHALLGSDPVSLSVSVSAPMSSAPREPIESLPVANVASGASEADSDIEILEKLPNIQTDPPRVQESSSSARTSVDMSTLKGKVIQENAKDDAAITSGAAALPSRSGPVITVSAASALAGSSVSLGMLPLEEPRIHPSAAMAQHQAPAPESLSKDLAGTGLEHSSLATPELGAPFEDGHVVDSSDSSRSSAYSEDVPAVDSRWSPELGSTPAPGAAMDRTESPELGESPAPSQERSTPEFWISPPPPNFKRTPGHSVTSSIRQGPKEGRLGSGVFPLSPSKRSARAVEMFEKIEAVSSVAIAPGHRGASLLEEASKPRHGIMMPDLMKSRPEHYLDMDLQAAVLDMHPLHRKAENLRDVFEAHIVEATSQSEPYAKKIFIRNDVDDEPCPEFEFRYTNDIMHSTGVPKPDSSALRGCDCDGPCDPKSKTCACALRQAEYADGPPGFVHFSDGRLRAPNDVRVIIECNSACNCSETCTNRVIQNGRKVNIEIRKTADKGWGVFATKHIAKGTFVGVYSGELLTEAEAERRGEYYDAIGRTYLFDVDFWHLRKMKEEGEEKMKEEEASGGGNGTNDHVNLYAMDAFHYGNFTRFLNHSCDPNCMIHAAYTEDADIRKPLLAFYTTRQISPNEELCFSYYGEADSDDERDEAPRAGYDACHCNTDKCRSRYF